MPRVIRPKTPAQPPARPARAGRTVNDRPTWLKLFLRKQRRLVRPAAWGLACLVALVLCVAVVRQVQPGSVIAGLRERFGRVVNLRVAEVRVEGRGITPEPLLRAAIGVNRNDPLLGFSLEQARARIEALTWVHRATVERRLPGTVLVTLEERRPFALWQHEGKFDLIDRAGQIVADQDPVKNAAAETVLPLVVGVGAPAAAAALLDALAVHPTLRSRVAAAVRVGNRRWNLRLVSGADVLLPEGAEAQALAKLEELQESQALLDRPLQVVDMRLPDRLVVRPQPEPNPPATGGSRRPT